jgi:hypothetical protein
MKAHINFTVLAFALIIALGMSLFSNINAIADDIPTPPAQSEEGPLPPTEAPVSTDVPVDELYSETVESPLALPTEAPVEETPADAPALLEQIPENTAVVVVTDKGIEPLATQAAVNTFVAGDPIWCPDNVSPGGTGCTGSYNTLYELITAIDNGTEFEPDKDGIIWILKGDDLSALPIDIYGSNFTVWAGNKLTLQGGWDGPGFDTATSNSVFNRPIEISGWLNDITINDIIINQSDSVGLHVDTSGNVVINDVSANENADVGLELISGGNVVFEGTNEFRKNDHTGLYVEAGGVISAQSNVTITASNNGVGGYGYGAQFTATGVDLLGQNTFNENWESGLYADVDGDITIVNLAANQNGTGGIYGAGAELISSGKVSLTGTNVFDGNLSDGLSVEAQDGIFVSDAQITDNLETGAYFISDGDVVLNCSEILSNDGYGVDANSDRLFLNGVRVDQNGDDDVLSSGSVFRISNSCFTYPVSRDGGGSGGDSGNNLSVPPPLPVNLVTALSGQNVDLDCDSFSGTTVSLSSGDGVFLPCDLGETARLIGMNQDSIPDFLPRGYKFISSFNLTVINGNQPLDSLGDPESVWFWNSSLNDANQEVSQALYWDGKNWVEVNAQIIPFMRVFFLIPEDAKKENLMILYWDGSNWVELKDNLNLGSGRFVHKGGHLHSPYFEAHVNFIGTFVLARK